MIPKGRLAVSGSLAKARRMQHEIPVENTAEPAGFLWTDFHSMPIRLQQVWNSA
jgi:hypothetical protein